MIERDLTQAQVARSLKVSRDAVSRAISGDSKPQSREIRKRLYKILGMEGE
nr:helix-turn-helix transcriptional regulator [Lactobacillus johnsonii]